MNWEPILTENDLHRAWEESHSVPVLIFKHSTRCSISTAALDRLNRKIDTLTPSIRLYFLDLLSYRSLSNTISERTGVEHASPQALLLRNGKCIYHASHFAIQASDLLQEASRK
jgi:bacillithiol system protein YtxJ